MNTFYVAAALFFTVLQAEAQIINPQLDTALVQQYGADAYGMRSYVFVMLRSGENPTTDAAFIDSCFTLHLRNIWKMYTEGHLLVAGPVGENTDDVRGIFIFNTPDMDLVADLLHTDPAIENDLLHAEIMPWYGSAALPAYLPVHEKIWKFKPE